MNGFTYTSCTPIWQSRPVAVELSNKCLIALGATTNPANEYVATPAKSTINHVPPNLIRNPVLRLLAPHAQDSSIARDVVRSER